MHNLCLLDIARISSRVSNFRLLFFRCSSPVFIVFYIKLAAEPGKDKPLASRVVPQTLSFENQKMGRKKIQISRINDERNRQVGLLIIYLIGISGLRIC